MPNIGPTGFILIILVALLLFGPSKLPELGRAFGRTLREFKNGAKEIMGDDDSDRKDSGSQRIESGRAQGNAQAAEQIPQQQTEQQQAQDKRLPE